MLSQSIQPQPRFEGASPLPVSLLQRITIPQKLALGLIGVHEGAYAHGKFIQNTLSSMGSRLPASRSSSESFEIIFHEIINSIVAWYGVAFCGKHLFTPLFAPKGLQKAMFGPLSKQSPGLVKRLLPARAAVPLASLLTVTLLGEWGMNYVKNLLTERNFRLSQFSDVANLSHQPLPEGKESLNADKARRRILQLSLATAGIIAGLAAFARFGSKFPGGLGFSRLVVKHLDFARKGRSLSISPNMLFAYMLVFVAGAMDSARDGLERKEVASRLAIILPYMLFVQEKVNLLTAKLAFPKLLKPNPGGSPGILKLSDKLFDEGLFRKLFQTKRLGKQAVMSLTDIARLAPKAQVPLLRNKIGHYLLSYGVGVIGVLVGTAFLNRYWTQKRFEASQKQPRQPVAAVSAFCQRELPYRAFRMTQS